MAFDLGEPRTYYTRPMPPAWSMPLDVERAADEQSELEFEVPLQELPRLRGRLASSAGVIRGRLRFRRDAGLAAADLSVGGIAALTCQRCLGVVAEQVSSVASIALIADERQLARVPEHLEPVLASGGRIRPAELIEEELLLALPIVPLHGATSECARASGPADADRDRPQPTTQRPFAQLGELFKR